MSTTLRDRIAATGTEHVLHLAGLLAWALVSWTLWQNLASSPWRVPAMGLALLFACGFVISTEVPPFTASTRRLRIGGLLLQTFSAVMLLPLDHNAQSSILAIVLVSQLPWYCSLRLTLPLLLGYLLIHYTVADLVWQARQPLLVTLIYGSFMLFALFATHNAVREQRGREELAVRNSALKATQHLLGESARQGERLRIGRDLHDTLGHHLSALSIQLEIASHLTEGEARAQIDKARHLSKLLLADVRASVSELREQGDIDLRGALRELVQDVPRLRVVLDCTEQFAIDDPARAEALLRATQELLTNTLRHSGATELHLSLRRESGEIRLHANDNGHGSETVVEGNGLRGMRERVRALGGRMTIDGTAGFSVNIALPEVSA